MERPNLPGDKARREYGRARGVVPRHMPAFIVAIAGRQAGQLHKTGPTGLTFFRRVLTHYPCHSCQSPETAKATAKNTGAPLFGS